MAEDSFQERSEPATQKKRDEQRRKGKVMKSVELNSSAILVFGLLLLSVSGTGIVINLSNILRETLAHAGTTKLSATVVQNIVSSSLTNFLWTIAPTVGGLMIIGLAASYAQVGFLFTLEPLAPKFSKINPLNGIKKVLISRRSLVELTKNLFKVTIVGVVAWISLNNVMENCVTLMDGSVESIFRFMATAALSIGLKTGLAFLVLAVFDYLYQRYEHEHELRMTRQEVKEEWKSQEGDPIVKGRVRTIQRQIAYKRMMVDVPKADVVVTNPTHLAIAIKYDMEKMRAPKVVAKGADLIAKRIRDVATEHGVPLVEDRPLAQTLYRTVDIGEEIPEKLFQAVAQVLAYIYRIRNMRPGYTTN
jgi:flagellar biosynthesis protein FlhB